MRLGEIQPCGDLEHIQGDDRGVHIKENAGARPAFEEDGIAVNDVDEAVAQASSRLDVVRARGRAQACTRSETKTSTRTGNRHRRPFGVMTSTNRPLRRLQPQMVVQGWSLPDARSARRSRLARAHPKTSV